eukprot:TRINITY_DN4709_c0_g1_i1.p1 TRINITY_DN4709_c0_g1~~TRINITY_DN4709_c0_g1_i1.p1  ORF type:complete len:363 (-),score=120.12 TRINITY_DN4709_c0_g1_i1:103-1191(-)
MVVNNVLFVSSKPGLSFEGVLQKSFSDSLELLHRAADSTEIHPFEATFSADIETKYYSCKIHFGCLRIEVEQIEDLGLSSFLRECNASVLIYDAADSTSFDNLMKFFNTLKSAENWDPSTMLFIAFGDFTDDAKEEAQRLIVFDAGGEFLTTSAKTEELLDKEAMDSDASSLLGQEGGRGSDGFRRIKGCLECTMWDSMVLTEKGQKGTRKSRRPEEVLLDDDSEDGMDEGGGDLEDEDLQDFSIDDVEDEEEKTEIKKKEKEEHKKPSPMKDIRDGKDEKIDEKSHDQEEISRRIRDLMQSELSSSPMGGDDAGDGDDEGFSHMLENMIQLRADVMSGRVSDEGMFLSLPKKKRNVHCDIV